MIKQIKDTHDVHYLLGAFKGTVESIMHHQIPDWLKRKLEDRLKELNEVKIISSNLPVSRRLPTSEDVKRWHQILTGLGEEAMQKDMEATFG